MSVMNRTTFPKDLEEGINAHFGMSYRDHPEEWREVFETENSEKQTEEDVLEYGFGAAVEKAEGGDVTYDSGGQAWSTMYRHITVALAFAITEEAIEDNLYQRLGPKFGKELGRSMQDTKEIYAAAILNNARASSGHLGGDSKTLLATDHPRADGGSYSNTLGTPAQISEPAMEEMLIKIRKAKNHRGRPIALRAQKLVIPPDQEFIAARIMQTVGRPGTADNDINAGRVRRGSFYNSEPCIVTRLTDPDAWFVRTDAPNGMKHFKRIAVQRGMQGDFNSGNARYKARERYSFKWTDPLGLYGSKAAA